MNDKNSVSNNILEYSRKIFIKKGYTLEEIIEQEDSDNFISGFIKTDKLNNLYDILECNYSKYLLKKVAIYRYMLSFNKDVFNNTVKKLLFSFKFPVFNTFEWIIKRVFFRIFCSTIYPKEVDSYVNFYTFFLKQYNVKNVFEVKEDSVVFDIGAFKGDTAYFFSKKMNGSGMVYAFEPDNNTFNVLKNVCEKYFLKNTKCYNVLFSDKSEIINFASMEGVTQKKLSTTVDDFIQKNNIEKIDFIKMDVEGGELSILKGSINTIKNLRPTLAIAIYHGGNLFFEDFITVPDFIKTITPNYKYYIRSFSPWGVETILYCIPN